MMRIRIKRAGIIAICLYMAGCNPQLRNRSEEDSTEKPVIRKQEKTKDVQLTFLDTLNSGKNIHLENSDLNSFKEQTFTESDISAAPKSNVHYRVQVFASSQIETIREKKKSLENKIDLPLFIAFDTPFYKLYVGDFKKRTQAEAVLPEIKKLGYTDAWVVSTRAISDNEE
ncbi:MAG: SPOR domain-containing protein [Fibrobacter sp.]|nr:SPOR domain-containing protein [Fibrobacter sp.]